MILRKLRDQSISSAIAMEIRKYVEGTRRRACAWCGTVFKPRNRYHFLCATDCRKCWYRGQFRPRPRD